MKGFWHQAFWVAMSNRKPETHYARGTKADANCILLRLLRGPAAVDEQVCAGNEAG